MIREKAIDTDFILNQMAYYMCGLFIWKTTPAHHTLTHTRLIGGNERESTG